MNKYLYAKLIKETYIEIRSHGQLLHILYYASYYDTDFSVICSTLLDELVNFQAVNLWQIGAIQSETIVVGTCQYHFEWISPDSKNNNQ